MSGAPVTGVTAAGPRLTAGGLRDRPGQAWTVSAIGLLTLSLGLPWAVAGDETTWVPGWYVAGSCVMDADGYLWCTPGFASPGFIVPGVGASMTGAASPARVFIVAAILAALWWLAGGPRRATVIAAGAVAVAVVLYGSSVQAGSLVALTAVAVLLAQRAGRLPAPPSSSAEPPHSP